MDPIWRISSFAGRSDGAVVDSSRQRSRVLCEKGSALLEFAMILPIFLLLLTGMASFGIALNQYLELTNAVAIGAQQLSMSRNAVSDPCSQAVTSVQNAAPFLAKNSINYKIVFTAPPGDNSVSSATYSGTSPTCLGAATSNMGLDGSVELTASYPCTLAVYGANLIPGCTLSAQVTEVIQ